MGWAGRMVRMCVVVAGMAAVTLGDDSLSPETVQRLKDATVYVKTKVGSLEMFGSGFVIQVTGDSALVATNHHVIARPKALEPGGFIPGLRGRDRLALRMLQRSLTTAEPEVTLVFNSGSPNEQALKAEIVGGLAEPDLAIVSVSGIKAPPTPIDFQQASVPVETMNVYILGFPFGAALATDNKNPAITIGKGSVSSIHKNAAGKMVKVQIDGAINPGNSGGPVVDPQGKLVGVSVQTIQGSNIGLAIPPGELAGLLEGRVGNPTLTAKSENGAPVRYEIVVPLVDPLKKLRQVSLQFMEGSVALDKTKSAQPRLAAMAGSKSVDFKLEGPVARAELPLAKPGDEEGKKITVQVSFVGGNGQPVLLDPQVLNVPAPLVTQTVKDENGNVTVTQTQKSKGRTFRNETRITRGGFADKSAFAEADSDEPEANDKPAEKKPAKTRGNADDEKSDGTTSGKKTAKSKGDADKEESDDKNSEKKPEAAWTNKIAKMKAIPESEVTGTLDGVKFTLDQAELSHGRLEFLMGPDFDGVFSQAELSLVLFTRPGQDVSGKKLVVNGKHRPGDPHIGMSTMREGDRIPKSHSFLEYLLVLEFGDYNAELRTQPGKIYICLPDRGKSFLAGTFEATVDD